MEQKHHLTNRDDVFLCIPPLYHTGAKFHWMGSLCAGSKAVLLKGTTPEIILDAVSKEHCTIVWLLVPWAQDILDSLDRGDLKLENYELSQWRLMHIEMCIRDRPKTITRSEGKAVRVVDKRNLYNK